MTEEEALESARAKGAWAGMNPPKLYERKEELAEGVTLYQGDCLALLPTLGNFDAIVTDPPYSSGGFNEGGKSAGSVGTRASALRPIQGDTMSTGGYFALMRRVLRECNALAAYVFTDWRMWPYTTEAVELSGFRLRGMIVWNKGSGGMGARWKAQHELVCWGTKVVSEMGAGLGNVITIPRSGNEAHPTEKPVDLMRAIVGNAEGSSVIDPFMGSGTTGVAAVKLRRKFTGIEIDPEHFDTACRRIEAALREPDMFVEPPKPAQQLSILDEGEAA